MDSVRGCKAVTENGKTTAFEYIYAYGSNASCSALAKNVSTSALFDKITFLNVIEGQQFADGTGLEESETEINVQAYAIQTTDLTSNDVTTPSCSMAGTGKSESAVLIHTWNVDKHSLASSLHIRKLFHYTALEIYI